MAAPINLGGTDPVYWWRADLGVTTVSGKISAWVSQGASGASLAQSRAPRRPTVTASGQNGQPCADFDSSGGVQWLNNTTLADVGPPFTLVVVQQHASGADWGTGEVAFVGGSAIVQRRIVGLEYVVSAGNGNTVTTTARGDEINAGVVVMRVGDASTGSSDSVRYNGVGIFASPDAGGSLSPSGYQLGQTPFGQPVSVGANAFAGDVYTGRVYEILVYDWQLSIGETLAVEQYIFERYAIARPERKTEHVVGLASSFAAGRARGGNRRSGGFAGGGRGSVSAAARSRFEPVEREQLFGVGVVSGAGSAALAPLAAVGAGDAGVTVTGTGSGALAPLAGDGAGSETLASSGSGAIAALSAAASGTEEITGSGAGAVAPLAGDGAGTETIASTGSGALAALAAAGAGGLAIDGTGAGALAALGATGDATETTDVTGSAALAPLVTAGAGTETIASSGAGGLAALGAAGAGALEIEAAGSCALAPPTAVGTGDVVSPVTSTGSASLAPLTSSASGALEISSVGACSIAPLSAACAGAVDTPIVLASLAATAATSARLVSTAASVACPAALTRGAVGTSVVAPSTATPGAATPTSARLRSA